MEEKKSLKEFLCTSGGFAVLVIVSYVVCFGLMAIIGGCASTTTDTSTLWGIISLIIVAVWTVFGWKSLSVIQPNIFLIMPLIGWVIYFIIKGFLSVIVGIFVAPYYIAKSIKNHLQKSLN